MIRRVDEDADGAVDGLEFSGEATLDVEFDPPSKYPPPLRAFWTGLPAMGLSCGRAAAGASSTTSENMTLVLESLLLIPLLIAEAGLDAALPMTDAGLEGGDLNPPLKLDPCLDMTLPPSPTPPEFRLGRTLLAPTLPDPGLDRIFPDSDLGTDPGPDMSLPEFCLERVLLPPKRLLRLLTATLLRLLGEPLLRLLADILPRRLMGMLTVGV